MSKNVMETDIFDESPLVQHGAEKTNEQQPHLDKVTGGFSEDFMAGNTFTPLPPSFIERESKKAKPIGSTMKGKVGRPPSSSSSKSILKNSNERLTAPPPSILRNSTGGDASQSTMFVSLKRRVKQIHKYVQLYPQLRQCLPNGWEYFADKELDALYQACKLQSSSDVEEKTVFAGFDFLIGKLELFALTIQGFVGAGVVPMLDLVAAFPPGSIGSYVKHCNQTGTGVDMELREIAIELTDKLPQSPFMRLLLKLSYKIYDFYVIQQTNYLQSLSKKMKTPVDVVIPDDIDRLYSGQVLTEDPIIASASPSSSSNMMPKIKSSKPKKSSVGRPKKASQITELD